MTDERAINGQADGWQESDSESFIDLGRILTPRRDEIAQAFRELTPARRDEPFVFVDIGAGPGWLSAELLGHFDAARAILLDGSPMMLRHAGALLAPFAGRFELRQFRLEQPGWPDALDGIRCFVSSLVIHHLDGPGKRALFGALYRRLDPGGALLIADLVAPASEPGRRYAARAWADEVRSQSLAQTGDLRGYEFFEQKHWNCYEYPDPYDQPSGVAEQLAWLAEAGFEGVDLFWARAGHALIGGYKPVGEARA